MENIDRPEEEWDTFLMLPRNLVSIGIKSAVKSLEILSDENIILGTKFASMVAQALRLQVHKLIEDSRDVSTIRSRIYLFGGSSFDNSIYTILFRASRAPSYKNYSAHLRKARFRGKSSREGAKSRLDTYSVSASGIL